MSRGALLVNAEHYPTGTPRLIATMLPLGASARLAETGSGHPDIGFDLLLRRPTGNEARGMNSPLESLLSLVVAAPCLRGREGGEQSALEEPAWELVELGERLLLAERTLLRLHMAAPRAEPEWVSSSEVTDVRAYPVPGCMPARADTDVPSLCRLDCRAADFVDSTHAMQESLFALGANRVLHRFETSKASRPTQLETQQKRKVTNTGWSYQSLEDPL